jgi:hypothetical protein
MTHGTTDRGATESPEELADERAGVVGEHVLAHPSSRQAERACGLAKMLRELVAKVPTADGTRGTTTERTQHTGRLVFLGIYCDFLHSGATAEFVRCHRLPSK